MPFLKKYLIGCAVLDVIWAALMATFGASILSSFGGLPADSLTTGSGWLIVFVAALFQGAIFMVVFSVFGALGLLAYSKSPPFIKKIMIGALVLDLVWAAIVATFGAGLLGHVGGSVGVDSGFSAVLLWIIGFVAGYLQGLIFMTVIGGFLAIILFLVAVLKNSSKNSGGRTINDRNPGEPPHR